MVGHGSKFDRKKEEAIAALLTQRSIEEAAKVAGIGTQTMYRWLKIPEFQAAYLEARRAAFSQTNARLQQASSAAVSTLLKNHGRCEGTGISPCARCGSHIRTCQAGDGNRGHRSATCQT